MSEIYPFRAILPKNGFEYKIHDHFLRIQSNCDITTKCYEKKIIYINNILKQNFLHLPCDENFFCCRISSNNFSMIGLIALVKVDAVNKTIFRHEKCINHKRDHYISYFKKYKTQIAPIILMHEDIAQIEANLNKIVHQQQPFFTIQDHEYQYDLWKVSDISYYKELYNQIHYFLVADGHHRLSSVSALSTNGLITAFLISGRDIKSSDIYRRYFDVSIASKNNLFLFLDSNFGMQKIATDEHVNPLDKIYLRIDGNTYQIMNSEDSLVRLKILEFLDATINYKNNELNFCNFAYNSNKDPFINDVYNVSILIPALQITNGIKNIPLYPPHSTLFYPKLPEGLVSFDIASYMNF